MKKFVFLFAIIALPTSQAFASDKVDIGTCKSYLLMNPDTDEILKEYNSDAALGPASMVKIMTTHVVLDQIAKGNVSLTDTVTVSAQASKIGGSQVYLKQGEQFSVDELLHAVMIQSANDAAYALAEHIGGSVEGFVDLMNDEAQSIGMSQSEFHSPHGLPPGKDQKPDLVSAKDMALLTKHSINAYPQILKLSSITEKGFRNDSFLMRNHNHLLRKFNGADGMKTGFYAKAGFSISATATRNGVRMIGVVMGCERRLERDNLTAKLLGSGFTEYRSVSLLEQGNAVVDSVKVTGGKIATTKALASEGFKAVVRRGNESKIEKKPFSCEVLPAPVQPNTPCGYVAFYLNDKELGRVNLIVAESIPEASAMEKIRQYIGI